METVQSVRIDHGTVPGSAMAYSQRQSSNHRFVYYYIPYLFTRKRAKLFNCIEFILSYPNNVNTLD